MSDELFSINHLNSGQPAIDHDAGMLRANSWRIGYWLAYAWRRILLGIVLIEIPLQIDTYFKHNPETSEFGAITGFNVSLTTICLFLLYAQWLPGRIVNSEKIQFSKSLTVFFAITIMSLLWAQNRSLAIYDIFLFFQAYLIFIYVVNTVKTRGEILFVLTLLLGGLAFQGLMMIAVKWQGAISMGPLKFETENLSDRLNGSLGSPNVAGSYLGLLLPVSLSVLFTDASRSLRSLAFIALMLGSIGLILTLSRGAWVATAFAFSLFFTIAIKRGWLSVRVLAMVSFGLVMLAAVFHEPISSRLLGEDNGSAESRFPLFEIALQIIAQNPLGVGTNNWDQVAQPLAEAAGFRGEWYYTVHNKYLLVWAEVGVLGLVAFFAFLLSTLYRGWRAGAESNRLLAPLAVGCTVAIAGQMIHMGFDVFNSRVQGQMLLLVVAIVFAISNVTTQLEAESPLGSDG